MPFFHHLLDVFGADPPAPVSNSPPPFIKGTIESIFALVPTSRIGNRSVRWSQTLPVTETVSCPFSSVPTSTGLLLPVPWCEAQDR